MPRPEQKLSRNEFIAAHPRCCYCNGSRPTVEIDHAPARIVFIKKHGPDGFEFPSCAACNRASALSELVTAYYIRTFDTANTDLDEQDFLKLNRGVMNNAPDAMPKFEHPTTFFNPMLDPTGIAQRSMRFPDRAKAHVDLFATKVLYAIYYRVSGKFAGTRNRYLVNWAQIGTVAADQMKVNGDKWFGEHVVGRRVNVDLGNQFRYQTGYHPDHGYFGIEMSFGGSLEVFGVIGPAKPMFALKPRLPLCPPIFRLGAKLGTRAV